LSFISGFAMRFKETEMSWAEYSTIGLGFPKIRTSDL